MTLTESQKAAYLADPRECPCCGGRIVSDVSDDFEWTYYCFSRPTECEECHTKWKEKYTLTGVTLTREPKE